LEIIKSLYHYKTNKVRNNLIDDFIFSSVFYEKYSKMIGEMDEIRNKSINYLKKNNSGDINKIIETRIKYWVKRDIIEQDKFDLVYSGGGNKRKLRNMEYTIIKNSNSNKKMKTK
jgi:hypothetical protein